MVLSEVSIQFPCLGYRIAYSVPSCLPRYSVKEQTSWHWTIAWLCLHFLIGLDTFFTFLLFHSVFLFPVRLSYQWELARLPGWMHHRNKSMENSSADRWLCRVQGKYPLTYIDASQHSIDWLCNGDRVTRWAYVQQGFETKATQVTKLYEAYYTNRR